MLSKKILPTSRFFQRSVQGILFSTAAMEKIQEKFVLPKRYANSENSVWNEYSQLTIEYKPLNLGEGFPDFAPPSYVTEALANVACSDDILLHQYTRASGHVSLVSALSKLYSKLLSRQINPLTEVLVTVGACEALFCSIIGHIDECDEVIIIEPFFDCYEPMVKASGGVARFIPLRQKSSCNTISSEDFVLDSIELERVFNKNTKAIILNTPNNPLGKVYTESELQAIADMCIKWNVMCISDEVYEWLVYDPFKHVRIATLPGMWERTVTIGSAGKTFGATGWKIGWALGPSNLLVNLQMVHQNCVQSCATPIQEAVARSIEQALTQMDDDNSYLRSFARESKAKRDFMCNVLSDVGMKPILPQGGYFVIADWSALESRVDLDTENDQYKDYRFTKWMIKNVGLQGIPVSPFYSEPNKRLGENFVRYCFVKKEENLQKAADILKKWAGDRNE